ncbi:MAG: hypothetical protein PXX77_01405 [Gallionella sp.]|nr:hypothetical protein [Gallionella sp.]
MAKSEKPSNIRRRISNDLLSLAQLLNQHSSAIVLNADVLKSSANQCSRQNSNKEWSYEVAGLRFRVKTPQNVLPTQNSEWLFVDVDLDVSGVLDESLDDYFTHLVLNICVQTENRESICSWHFDRHIIGDAEEESDEAHPLYHFQHGGHAMKEISETLGKVLLLPTPRLPFPPMDAVLAIDFLLSNFAGAQWKELRNEHIYVNLLKQAQCRHWKPYLKRLASWWDTGPKQDASVTSLFPQLV